MVILRLVLVSRTYDKKIRVKNGTTNVNSGGVLLFTEGNFQLLNEHKQPQEIAFGDGLPGQSWFARTLFGACDRFSPCSPPILTPTITEAYNAMKARGSSMDAGVMLERYLQRCPEITNAKVQDVLIPIGPWEKGKTTAAILSSELGPH